MSHCCRRWWIPSPAVSYGNRLCFQPTAGYVNGLKPRNVHKTLSWSFQEKKKDSVIWHSTSFSTAFHAIRQLKFTKPQNSLPQILGKSTTWTINFILKPPRSVDLKLFKTKYLKPAHFLPHFKIPPRYQGTCLLRTEKASDVYYLRFQSAFYLNSDPSKLDV